ncbi:hypothetical protein NDU88_001472 [Pleurodeles waltl]|uniref:Uncharacterized protein n=1 Tax=Pleurodeles waltl TaxID=8319 RepID=A0AAV7U6G7_PLEWA|nr:hypothetical protein NDU88_001470 [Pleurodeles waltl]KAJ1184668.1 hypothetical protein NDU88_001471 [Pleurodeles waltl]KAJ1184669.1 hypothetical protein NDU88_001472 [Pleurodeles waltl]
MAPCGGTNNAEALEKGFACLRDAPFSIATTSALDMSKARQIGPPGLARQEVAEPLVRGLEPRAVTGTLQLGIMISY